MKQLHLMFLLVSSCSVVNYSLYLQKKITSNKNIYIYFQLRFNQNPVHSFYLSISTIFLFIFPFYLYILNHSFPIYITIIKKKINKYIYRSITLAVKILKKKKKCNSINCPYYYFLFLWC